MKSILLISAVALAIGIAFVPGATATPGMPDCDLDATHCYVGWVKTTSQDLDPRDWPCTCPPPPQIFEP